MKKLIYEVVTIALISSLTGNIFAANSSAKTQPNKKVLNSDGTRAVITPVEVEPKSFTERMMKLLGVPTTNPAPTKKFSEVVLQHMGVKTKTAPKKSKTFDQVANENSGRGLGIVNADGSLNLVDIDLPALRLEPKAEIIASEQMTRLLMTYQGKKQNLKDGFYYPSASETHYILKLTSEEAKQYKKDFSNIEFENAGVEGNILKLRVKNPRNNENVFVGYKLQPELLKKFSPLMVQDTMMSKFRDASAHATASFPVEAMTFYVGIYFNTLLNLSLKYKDDPAALEKFYAETTSLPGQLSFFAFMLGNRLFTNLVGPNINHRVLKQLLPFIGMGVGSIASAVAHDVMTLTNSCAMKLMKVDEFNDDEKASAMAECQNSYNQVVSSSNAHNYITSFMNILVAGAGSAVITQAIATSAGLATKGTIGAVSTAAQVTGNGALAKTAMTLEGIAFEYKLAQQEMKAYSLSKNLMKAGKLSTTARLTNWFGFIPGKSGNLFRFGLNFGRLGWKIAGGIVIFLQADEIARPYTYYNEQLLMGSGSNLSMLKSRYSVQLDHLAKNNWTETICQTHANQNKKNNFKSFYTEHPEDCELIEKAQGIKKESKLWRDSILYKFMASYTNWLMYVESFHSEWNMTYTLYDEFVNYAYQAKLANFDLKKSERFNPLLHDDNFWGVQNSDRISQDGSALSSLMTIDNSLTFEGMNKIRAQKVIDLLPVIGKKLKEIQAKDFKYKDWMGVQKTLLQLATHISTYMVLSARQSGISADKNTIIKDHFAKKSLSAQDLPASTDYTELIKSIDLINKSFDDYTSAYKSSKKAVPSRDRSAQEAAYMYSLYEKAVFFKNLRSFLGNPKPSARGEAFIRSFDEYVKSSYTEEQIKNASKKTGSVGKDLLWQAMCAQEFIKSADIENQAMKNGIADSSWGKNVKFRYPRITEKIDFKNCNNFDGLIPTRGTSATQTPMDYLMKNISSAVLSSNGSEFSNIWDSSILPRIENIYKKFDQSYQSLIKEQFIPNFMGANGNDIIATSNPLEAYKKIQAQPRARLGYKAASIPGGSAGGSVIQTYVDEADSYLKILNDSFIASLKQDVAIKFASNATQKQKDLYLQASEKRKQRFDTLASHFRAAFARIILSFGDNNVNVEKEYAGLLLTYFNLIKSVGLVGDIQLEQKNVEENGEVVTKVVGSISRNTFAEMLLQQYLLENKKGEIESFIKSQESRYGVSSGNSKQAFAQMFINNVVDQSFAGKMKLRLENQADIRHAFQEMKETLEADTSINNAYNIDKNMSLPEIEINKDTKKMSMKRVAGTLMYSQVNEILPNQFLGLLGASQSIDELMEEVYFNVNILKAASIDNKYRNVETERLKKFKSSTMGGI